jgi:hypothetical protein
MTIHTSPIIVPGTYKPVTLDTSRSPWGRIQESDILMWGCAADRSHVPLLWQVHTAGHGGTRVHPEVAARYFRRLPKDCHAYGGSRLWFEEDCESTVPLFIFYNALAPSCWLVRGENPFPRHKLLESMAHYHAHTVPAVSAIARTVDDDLARAGVALRSAMEPASA